jgi:DNA-binding XRE family transcriptional regulator
MATNDTIIDGINLTDIRAHSKVLARQDRNMKVSLISVRQVHNLTQQEVADRMGVTLKKVIKLEQYDSDPKLSLLRRYAVAVGADIYHQVRLHNTK